MNALQADLASHEPPPETRRPRPSSSRTSCGKVVEDVSHVAQQTGVALPEEFYLGFEQYRGSPPDAAATPLLNCQLNAINGSRDASSSRQRSTSSTSIKRAPLPQESRRRLLGGATPRPPGPGKPGAPAGDLVGKHPVEIAFTAQPSRSASRSTRSPSDKRLFVVRALQVKNQVDKGPPRDARRERPGRPAAVAAGHARPDRARTGRRAQPAAARKGPPPLRYVVGQEKLDVVAAHRTRQGDAARRGRPAALTLSLPHPSRRSTLHPPPSMTWVKQNYDRFLLALFAAALLVCAGLLFNNARNYNDVFNSLKGPGDRRTARCP